MVERAWVRGIGLGLLAVMIHGLWNFAAVGQTLVSLDTTGATRAGATMLTALLVSTMLLMWFAAFLALIIVPRRLAEAKPGPADRPGTPAIPSASWGEEEVRN